MNFKNFDSKVKKICMKFFFGQNEIVGSKKNCRPINLGQKSKVPKRIRSTHILGPKIFRLKKCCAQKSFGSKTIFCPKNFRPIKILRQKRGCCIMSL